MISTVHGSVQSIEEAGLVIVVSGIGFFIQVPHQEYYETGQTVHLFTHLYWNQETGPQIFGFATYTERLFFVKVMGCSGLGPKLALSLLNQAPLSTYVAAISLGDIALLNSIKGLGPKKAETLIRELRNKIDGLSEVSGATSDHVFVQHIKDIRETLSVLKYSHHEIGRAVDYVSQQQALKTESFDHLLRVALAQLTKPSREQL